MFRVTVIWLQLVTIIMVCVTVELPIAPLCVNNVQWFFSFVLACVVATESPCASDMG